MGTPGRTESLPAWKLRVFCLYFTFAVWQSWRCVGTVITQSSVFLPCLDNIVVDPFTLSLPTGIIVGLGGHLEPPESFVNKDCCIQKVHHDLGLEERYEFSTVYLALFDLEGIHVCWGNFFIHVCWGKFSVNIPAYTARESLLWLPRIESRVHRQKAAIHRIAWSRLAGQCLPYVKIPLTRVRARATRLPHSSRPNQVLVAARLRRKTSKKPSVVLSTTVMTASHEANW